MSTTAAKIGYGLVFSIYNGSTYTAVAECTGLDGVGYEKDMIDATTMASPSGFREMIPGLKKFKPFTVSLNYVPSASDVLVAALTAENGQFKITWPGGVNVVTVGNLSDYAIQTPVDDKMSCSVVVTPTSVPTWAAS